MKRVQSSYWDRQQFSGWPSMKKFQVCEEKQNECSYCGLLPYENQQENYSNNSQNICESDESQLLQSPQFNQQGFRNRKYFLNPLSTKSHIEFICQEGRKISQRQISTKLGEIVIISGQRLILNYFKIDPNLAFDTVVFGFNNNRLCLFRDEISLRCYQLNNIPQNTMDLFNYCIKIIAILAKSHQRKNNQQINPEQQVINSNLKHPAKIIYKLTDQQTQLSIEHSPQMYPIFNIQINSKMILRYSSISALIQEKQCLKKYCTSKTLKQIINICVIYWYEYVQDL